MAPYAEIASAAAVLSFVASKFAPQLLVGNNLPATIVVYCILAFVGLRVWDTIIVPHYVTPLRKLPQPEGGSYFMGQFIAIVRDPSGEPHRQWLESVPNDGLIYYRGAFNGSRVIVTTPKGLAEVMVQRPYDFIKPPQVRRGLGRLLGIGILLAEGDEHKRQRKSLNPAFAFRHVKNVYPVFWAKAREMVLAIDKAITLPVGEEQKPSNVIEVQKWASRSTLDIIGVTGFDKSFNAVEDESSKLYQLYQKVFTVDRNARILGFMNLMFPEWFVRSLPIKQNLDIIEAADFIRQTCRDLIQNKKEKIKSGDSSGVDILSVAMNSGAFDDEDLVNQLMTFLAAGHETTASAMTLTAMLLCQHPEIQQKLRKELFESKLPSVRDTSKQITSDDIDGLPYLSAVCQEVLRFYPPVPLTLRLAAKDTTILGQFIPKGTTVVLCPQAINRSKDLWGPDANEFKPERWMKPGCANTGGADSNYAFMTFLHGPRSCIGSAFARSEFACILATWVMAFETELEDPTKKIEIAGGITQRPKGGLRVKVTPVARS